MTGENINCPAILRSHDHIISSDINGHPVAAVTRRDIAAHQVSLLDPVIAVAHKNECQSCVARPAGETVLQSAGHERTAAQGDAKAEWPGRAGGDDGLLCPARIGSLKDINGARFVAVAP